MSTPPRPFPFTLTAEQQSGLWLVVDDAEPMRSINSAVLRRLGVTRVATATNGHEALQILNSQTVVMVLSDWSMPGMNGLELLRAMRSDEQLRNIPFLLITSEVERELIVEAINSGVSELLVKPYTTGMLIERIFRATRWQFQPKQQTAATASAPLTEPASSHRRSTILVVDDEPGQIGLLINLLKESYRVQVATSGESALRICHSDTPPDMVLLDIMLPGLSGFDVAVQLRQHPSTETMPILFITGVTDVEARRQALALGAVDFINKPLEPHDLLARIRNFMGYVELHRCLQADYDEMLANRKLRYELELLTSHDLKIPIAGMIGIIQELAESTNLSGPQKAQLQLVEETAITVLGMASIDQELYKIETGTFELDVQPVDLKQVLTRLAAIASRSFSAKTLSVTFAVAREDRTSWLAQGNTMLCYALFQALVRNACEASPQGGTVLIQLNGASELVVTITNKGVVPPRFRSSFFENRMQQTPKPNRGIGAYTAKRLVEAQGGTITMDTNDSSNTTLLTVILRGHSGMVNSPPSTTSDSAITPPS
ncbi:MAG: response regulator [Gammaproteobacteria bacterium]|nr:response regulator [Gammaproteobacteria bacterium]